MCLLFAIPDHAQTRVFWYCARILRNVKEAIPVSQELCSEYHFIYLFVCLFPSFFFSLFVRSFVRSLFDRLIKSFITLFKNVYR